MDIRKKKKIHILDKRTEKCLQQIEVGVDVEVRKDDSTLDEMLTKQKKN